MLLPQPEVLPAAAGTLVPSSLTSFLYTEVLGHRLSALLTLHRAAPVEFTVAARHRLSFALLHGQATLSTQPPATPFLPFVQVLAFLEALTALGARQAQSTVFQAVIRGVFQVDQLLARDGAKGLGNGPTTGCTVPGSSQKVHLQGPVVLLLQIVPHLSKFWQLQPAGLSSAASRYTVALTRPLHGPFHSLETRAGTGKFTLSNYTF